MNGILCIDKPAQMTSFSCCVVLRRLLGEKKVGHAGTLDPNATGVLPLLIGRATKALDHLPIHDKRYTATLRFGCVSDTLDIWGQVRPTGLPIPTLKAIEAALPAFRGAIQQIPPMTSALKQNGVRLYDLARQGMEVPRQPRPVTIHHLDILSYDPNTGELTLDCACSKGTYIRTICDDLGQKLGCGAVMTALKRTEAAGYTLADCLSLEQVRQLAEKDALRTQILPVEHALKSYPAVTVTAAQATRFQNGGALFLERLRTIPTGIVRVYDPEQTFIGLGTPAGDLLTITQLF